jgi:RNA polymerase sigma factor (sigma-70 family)
MEVEDLEQELTVQLLAASRGYDARKGPVEAFVRTVLDRAIGQHIRKCRTAKRNDRGTVPLPVGDTIAGPFGADSDTQDLLIDLANFIDRISEEDRLLAEQLRTMSLSEIARLRRVPRSTLHRAVQRLRKRFEDAGLKIYLSRPPSSRP